ncbi:MAG TPA: RDD family protein [Kofleriaceae bacterium]|nr:RDD family protein [Kofleriaceae bacterium]
MARASAAGERPGRRAPGAAAESERGRLREVVTPEGVPLALRLAERGDRAAAFLIDMVVMAVAIAVLVFLVSLAARSDLGAAGGGWTMPLVLLALFFLRNFYFLFFEIRWRGQTPGKRALKIRVIDRRGGPLTADAVIARNLMREVEVFLPLAVLAAPEMLWPGSPGWARFLASAWALVLAFLPLFNRDRLRVGDLVGGTMVVLAPRAVLLPDIGGEVAEQAARARTRYQFTPEQLEVYGIYELQVLEGVLRHQDDSLARYQSIEVVCEKIKEKIGWDRDSWLVDSEQFLREFYAALRAHLERGMMFGKRREDKFSRR